MITDEQKRKFLKVADRLSAVANVIGMEVGLEGSFVTPNTAYDFASLLQDIEAELLTIPHKRKE